MSLETQINELRFGLERRGITLTPFTELETYIPGDPQQTMIEFDGDPNTITREDALINFPTYIDGKYSIYFASLFTKYNQFSDGGKSWICTKIATDTTPPVWEITGISAKTKTVSITDMPTASKTDIIIGVRDLSITIEKILIEYEATKGTLREIGTVEILTNFNNTQFNRESYGDDIGLDIYQWTIEAVTNNIVLETWDVLVNGLPLNVVYKIQIVPLTL